MKAFKQNTEIRLNKDDLIELLEDALDNVTYKTHCITQLTLYPGNYYVVRLTIKEKE